MPFFTDEPRPQVSPRPHLFRIEPPAPARDSLLAAPDLFWATRLKAAPPTQEPKPSAVHPRPLDPAQSLVVIEQHRFTGTPWEEEFPASMRRAWQARMEVSLLDTFRAMLRALPLGLAGGQVTIQRAGDWLESAEIVLRLTCQREGGRPIGTVEQELDFSNDDPVAFTTIEESLGWEAERGVLDNSVRLYDKVGISMVKLLASGQRGYTWAKCGFLPDSEEDAWELFSELERRLEKLKLTARTRSVVRNLLSGHRPQAAWALSDLERVRVTSNGRRTSMGRALLEDTSWPAVLNLDDPVARARFERNVRRC